MILKRIQLGLIHVAVAMTLVPINSTLNRIMIKELAISATLVAVLASLPYLFSPIQVAIGSFSDRHPIFGWRRTPYIFFGLLLCVTGVVLSPRVAFTLADRFWPGVALGVLAFGAWGMGFNFATVSYLALASELSGEKGRSRTISVMWFMMIAGIILTAITLSRLLDIYTPESLQRAFSITGGLAVLLGSLGLLKLEKRSVLPQAELPERTSWRLSVRAVAGNRQARRFFLYMILLLAAILGQDILLEPYAAEAFSLPVSATTRITSIWGGCVLLSLLVTGLLEGKVGKRRMVVVGSISAILAFVLVAISGLLSSLPMFYSGILLLGLATGISTVSNLSLMLDMTLGGRVGLFIGAWGMAEALARALGSVMSGAIRDLVAQASHQALFGYVGVFFLDALMLVVSLGVLRRVRVDEFQETAGNPSALQSLTVVERVTLANDA